MDWMEFIKGDRERESSGKKSEETVWTGLLGEFLIGQKRWKLKDYFKRIHSGSQTFQSKVIPGSFGI